jgi:hypothetical protein
MALNETGAVLAQQRFGLGACGGAGLHVWLLKGALLCSMDRRERRLLA